MNLSASRSSDYRVPALERGLQILSLFTRSAPVLSAPEMAQKLAVKKMVLPRATLFRLLCTLEDLGYVEKADGGHRYKLGLAVLRLGFDYLASLDIVARGRTLVDALRDQTGYSASLVLRDETELVYVYRAAPKSAFASAVSVGTRLPLHATVLGTVLLCDCSVEELQALYGEAPLPAFSKQTPKSVAQLYQRTQAAATLGSMLGQAYFEAHISSVAAPVFGETGRVVAAVGLTVPSDKIAANQQAKLAQAVRQCALKLSAKALQPHYLAA